jgi:hypothetical protein
MWQTVQTEHVDVLGPHAIVAVLGQLKTTISTQRADALSRGTHYPVLEGGRWCRRGARTREALAEEAAALAEVGAAVNTHSCMAWVVDMSPC